MGTLLLNFGQCGCQIGMQLLGQMERSPMIEANTFLKRQDSSIYHSILVDTEPKILKPVIEDRKRFPYIDTKNVMFYQFGRGNNWGLGYMDYKKKNQPKKQTHQFDLFKNNQQSMNRKQMKKKNDFIHGNSEISTETYFTENAQIIEALIDQTRREIEKTDYFMGILFIMSLAGGTGSGLGSRMIEEMRDIFEEVQLNSVAILPNQAGETPLQHYNCLLSLSHLQRYADSIIYFENDRIYSMLSQIGSKQVDKSVDLTNVNEYISSCLMNMMWINDNHSNNRFYQDMLSECCVTPELKFVELMTAPFQLFRKLNCGPECTWEEVIKKGFEQFIFESQDQNQQEEKLVEQIMENMNQQQSLKSNKVQSLSVQCAFRSVDVNKSLCESESHMRFLERKIKQVFNPVSWNPDAVSLQFVQERSQQKGLDQKMCFAMANSNKIVPIVRNVSKVAYQKYCNNAYLHWYMKYGVENDQFSEAFEQLQCIDDNYSEFI